MTQCKAAGTPAFVKQLGRRAVARTPDDITEQVYREIEAADVNGDLDRFVGDGWKFDRPIHYGFRHRKGGDPAEWPEDLRVREWPSGKQEPTP